MYRAFIFSDSDDAYDESQVNDEIRDGDILLVPSEGVVGFLYQAWPIAISEAAGAFHQATPQGLVSMQASSKYGPVIQLLNAFLRQKEIES